MDQICWGPAWRTPPSPAPMFQNNRMSPVQLLCSCFANYNNILGLADITNEQSLKTKFRRLPTIHSIVGNLPIHCFFGRFSIKINVCVGRFGDFVVDRFCCLSRSIFVDFVVVWVDLNFGWLSDRRFSSLLADNFLLLVDFAVAGTLFFSIKLLNLTAKFNFSVSNYLEREKTWEKRMPPPSCCTTPKIES